MLFLNGIGSCIGQDPFLNYGEYCLTYKASPFNTLVIWDSGEETDEEEREKSQVKAKLNQPKEIQTCLRTQHPMKLESLLLQLQATVELSNKPKI